MRNETIGGVLLIISAFFIGCGSQGNGNHAASEMKEKSQPETESKVINALPHVYVYKTKEDYRNQVAVQMDEAKAEIISYPAPTDVNPEQAKPTSIGDDYFLDNQGINKNSVFLEYTFSEYAALAEAPTLAKMKSLIIDKDPFTELWQCENRQQYKNLEEAFKQKVKEGMDGCKQIK